MTSPDTSNMAQSVHDRLLAQARRDGRPFGEVLQYFAMERFLYRLSRSSHRNSFVLKGGLMLLVWGAPLARPTRDIDLLGRMSAEPETIAGALREVCSQSVEEDGLEFDRDSIRLEPITRQAEYQGLRVVFDGFLGTARIPMRVDIGIGDVVTPAEECREYPVLLGLPAPRLKTYPPETVIAEKAEAMVRLGEINSRMQDFFDIRLLAGHFEFDGSVLCQACRRTLNRRGTPINSSPTCLSTRFASMSAKQMQWTAFIDRNRIDATSADFAEVVADITEFIGPVLSAVQRNKVVTASWRPGRGWSNEGG